MAERFARDLSPIGSYVNALSTPDENSSFRRLKISSPCRVVVYSFSRWVEGWKPAGEVEVSSGGDQPAKE
jgi:hypothetical protein